MDRDALLGRIQIDPRVCFGKPTVRGTRIWVSLVLDRLADGVTPVDLLRDYPSLKEADIHACLAYGAEIARENVVPVPRAPDA